MSAKEQQKLKQRADGHWDAICELREKLNQLYEQGEPFTSEKMIRIGIEIDRRGKQLIELDRQYEDLLLAELPE